MKTQFFLFLFVFVFCIGIVNATSLHLTSPIPDQNLTNSQTVQLDLSNYATGYDFVTLFVSSFDSLGDGNYIYLYINGSTYNATAPYYTTYRGVTYILKTTGSRINVTITTSSIFQYGAYMNVFWFNSSVYPADLVQYNAIIYQNVTSGSTIDTGTTGNANANDAIGALVNGWISFFPPASSINLITKFAYVFISILVFFVLYYLVIFAIYQGKFNKVSSFFHYVFFIVVIVMCFFFIAVGYIPIGVLIAIILIIAVLAFFRFKSGFSAQGK